MKKIALPSATLLVMLTVAGCATPPAQVLDGMEPQAIETALQRGRFDLQCPSAQPTVLSRQLRPPVVETIRFAGVPHGIFTIGVSGCGKQMTFQIACPEGGYGCFSADGLENLR
jgi:hypothetical protein